MVPLGAKAFSIVAGGILLGTLGSLLVRPVPREPEPHPWQLTGRPEFTAPAESYQWVEAGPEDLTPSAPDSFPPSWASDPTIWQYPEPRIAEWEPEPYPTLAELDARLDADAAAAEEAEQAATEAQAGAEQPADPAPEPKQPVAEGPAPQLAAIY